MDKYKKSYLISSFECDIKLKLRIRSLFNLFQDMADYGAEAIGVGYKFCQEHGLGWVGGGYHVKISKLPKWKENIHIETWPSATTAACGIRDFRIFDDMGNPIILATSQWVLVDTERMRPVPVAKRLPKYELINESALQSDFSKISEPECSFTTVTFPVHADDLDLNHHVNNALYPCWCLDAFDEIFLTKNYPAEIKINFKRSAKKGDIVVLKTYMMDNVSTHVLTNQDGTVEFARILMGWEKE